MPACTRVLDPGELSCAIVAPTGLAAFNVGGLTIHRLFQLPIEHEVKLLGIGHFPRILRNKPYRVKKKS